MYLYLIIHACIATIPFLDESNSTYIRSTTNTPDRVMSGTFQKDFNTWGLILLNLSRFITEVYRRMLRISIDTCLCRDYWSILKLHLQPPSPDPDPPHLFFSFRRPLGHAWARLRPAIRQPRRRAAGAAPVRPRKRRASKYPGDVDGRGMVWSRWTWWGHGMIW